ncbi:MAG TPA: solute carrier family 23 protein [Methylomusa anaerophila]|uniref:Putative purine permease YbbY n=1 Tax=Methylomusa anaerophila TaxID=1930071 RepID=A0A348AFX8_9FIRM|nr:solute carrier family 23 protein [Methylomusa anaerophila]BBB89976.1 putative purine permease YbbY [Methylomusa anaerophila]HML88296.1 solute carrier family 23 protein [Methylomusa anaerophila]
MNQLHLKYNVEDKPPLGRSLLFGLQWMAIIMPMVIFSGKAVAGMQFSDPAQQIVYIQKIFFIIGISILIQVLCGHKLPLVIGPAAVLLVGITASQGSSISSVYTSILVGGLLLAILSSSGLLKYVQKLFTPRVVATILILISFTLIPMILQLIFAAAQISPLANLLFALVFLLLLFLANKSLKGIWRSTLIAWSMVVGSIVYVVLFPQAVPVMNSTGKIFSGFFQDFNTAFSLDFGTLTAFIICFLALAINDLGSIQSIGDMLYAGDMPKRITKGITLTGVFNIFAGFLGVIGPVNYSLSPGVIASTGVASRFTLLPAGIGLILTAFLPPVINVIGIIPSAVIGSTFIYTMCSQLAAGLLLAFHSMKNFRLEDGLILGLPLMLGVLISFLPTDALASFPLWLKPVLGNGFVVGVIAVLIMEHIVYRPLKNKAA